MAYSVFVGAGQWHAARADAPAQGLFGFDAESERWEPLTDGLPADVEVRHLAIRPDRPQTVYAGTQDGPYRSDDGGRHWRALPLPAGTPAEEHVVWSICLAPEDPETVYVGTQGTGVFRSRDGGGSWERLPVPVPQGAIKANFPTRITRIAVEPGAGGRPGAIHVGLEVAGVLRSLDGGATWQSGNPSLLAMAEQPRLQSRILSDDDTEGMMDSHAVTVSPAHPGTVWLANRMGLFRSDDRGLGWTEIGIGRFSPLTYARDVRVSGHDPQRMYAALSVAAISDAGSLYRSDDFGASWRRFDHGVEIASTLMVVAEGVTRPERVYGAARRGQIVGTEDGGSSWRSYDLPDGVEGVYALACV